MNWNLLQLGAQLIPVLGPIIAFFTPKRCMALFAAVQATINYVDALNTETPDDDYAAAHGFLLANKALLVSVLGDDPEINKLIEERLIPFILQFIYSPGINSEAK